MVVASYLLSTLNQTLSLGCNISTSPFPVSVSTSLLAFLLVRNGAQHGVSELPAALALFHRRPLFLYLSALSVLSHNQDSLSVQLSTSSFALCHCSPLLHSVSVSLSASLSLAPDLCAQQDSLSASCPAQRWREREDRGQKANPTASLHLCLPLSGALSSSLWSALSPPPPLAQQLTCASLCSADPFNCLRFHFRDLSWGGWRSIFRNLWQFGICRYGQERGLSGNCVVVVLQERMASLGGDTRKRPDRGISIFMKRTKHSRAWRGAMRRRTSHSEKSVGVKTACQEDEGNDVLVGQA